MIAFLIPVDFSDVSYTTAQYGLDMASYVQARQIVFYHSYREMPRDPSDGESPVRQEVLLRLAHLVQNLHVPAQIDQSMLVFEADDRYLDDGIERLVGQYSISMIVMGISGISDADNPVIGHHTLSVASAAPAPLLIVPCGHRFAPVRKIVYATDLREVETTTPVVGIMQLARQLGAQTHVIHVDYGTHRQTAESEAAQNLLLHLLADLNPTFEVVRQHKDKAYGIFDYVDRHKIDLILMASRNYGFFERIFHNSVSKKLLSIAEVPVLLLKNRTSST